jgi:hypothetical protein
MRIEQGVAFRLGIRILDENGQPVTLTGYSARLQIRDYPEAPDPPLAEMCLGTAKGGQPLHPSRLAAATRLEPYRPGAAA